jgi:hypothetical protein
MDRMWFEFNRIYDRYLVLSHHPSKEYRLVQGYIILFDIEFWIAKYGSYMTHMGLGQNLREIQKLLPLCRKDGVIGRIERALIQEMLRIKLN